VNAGRVLLVLTAEDEVITVTKERHPTRTVRLPRLFKPHINHVMRKDVSENGAALTALWNPFLTDPQLSLRTYPALEHPGKVAQETRVTDFRTQHLEQHWGIKCAKEIGYINVNNGLNLVAEERVQECSNGIMTPPSRPEPLGALQKQGLVNALQPLVYHLLHEFVLKVADAQRTHRARLILFGNEYVPYWSRPIRHALHPGHQPFEIVVQFPSIVRFVYSIRSHSLPSSSWKQPARDSSLKRCLKQSNRLCGSRADSPAHLFSFVSVIVQGSDVPMTCPLPG
jgi:hypothetical protein